MWYLLHCPCCLRAKPALSSAKAQDKDESASDENNDDSPEVNSVLPPPFSAVYHTTHLGRVEVLTSCFQRVLVNREKLAKLVTQMRVSKGVSVDEDTVLRWVGELGVSGSPQVLSLKASICSAAEELKRVLALEQAQEVYAEFGDESSSVDLAKIKGAVRKATQTLSALQARLPSSESRYLPENDVEGNAEWRAGSKRQDGSQIAL